MILRYPDSPDSREDIAPAAALTCLLLLVLLYSVMCLYGSWKGFTGNFDTGTVELMAVNIAGGRDFPLFWYGQHYAGALEAYLAATMISMFGFSEPVLTLSPILFSVLWLVGTYLLFSEIIDRRAGLIAVVAAVFSGYYAWYYSYALSGGYAAILGFGTLIMWLGVRIYTRDPSFSHLCDHILAISLLSALAIWVHFFIFPYLLVTALCLLLYLVRHRFAAKILCCYGVGALIATCGLIPFLIVNNGHLGGSSIATFHLQWEHLRRSLQALFFQDLSQYVFWKDGIVSPFDSAVISRSYLFLLFFVAGCGLLYILRQRRGRRIFLLVLPVFYLLVFAVMFLPHEMSVIPAARYLLGPWAMLVSMVWAYSFTLLSGPQGRVLFACLLFFWVGYNGFGDYLFVRVMAPRKEARMQEARRIIDLARSSELKGITILGNERYGYEGQKLSALSDNEIRFVFSGRERYQKNAQALENEPAYGFMCRAKHMSRIRATLQPLAVPFQSGTTGTAALFCAFRVGDLPRQAVVVSRQAIHVTGHATGTAEDLTDRNASSTVTWNNGTVSGSLLVDFGRVREVNGFWLFGAGSGREGEVAGLPERYQVSIAGQDRIFQPVLSFHSKVAQSYVQGGHVYVAGYFGKAECRFSPRPARFLRIRFPARQQIRLGEVVFFQAATPVTGSAEGEVIRICNLLRENGAQFTLADRWLSAAVLDTMAAKKKRLPALPRFNPRADDQDYSRLLIPRRGLVLAPAREVADDCALQIVSLYGPRAIRRRIDLDRYSLFFLDQAARKPDKKGFLYWNGHLLVRLTDYGTLATINLIGAGLPYLDPHKGKNSGFYRDGWTNGEGVFRHRHLRVAETAHTLILVTNGNAPHGGDPEAMNLQILVNGRQLAYSHRERGCYFFLLPRDLDMIKEVRIRSTTFVPATRDRRTLGMDVVRVLIP